MTDYVPGHGDSRYSVQTYALDIDYSVDGNRLTGRTSISAVAEERLTDLTLDLHGLSVAKLTVDGKAPARYTHKGAKLEVRLATPIEAGQSFGIVVGYHGNPAPMPGVYGEAGWEELTDGVIVASQPHGAPSWFPCNDRPSDKASYTISVNAPSDYHVVANGRLASSRRRASSTTWVYEQPEPMASYLASVQIGRYQVHDLDAAVPMQAVLPPARAGELDATFGRQPEMLDVFVRLFGDYPFSNYRVVVTDDELEIPLEAQGLSIFGSNYLTDSWGTERLVAHELAHQWFGNSLTVADWKDIWLHEGFACYAEWLWSEQTDREPADHHARSHWERLADLPQDVLIGDPGPDDMFDDRIYKRGALLLHALRMTIGDHEFFALLKTWTARHAHGSVRTEQLVDLAELVTGRRLRGLFDEWLYAEALPRLPQGH